MYSEQNLKSDVRNVSTVLGFDIPGTKPELPQAGPGWQVGSGGAGGGRPFFGHVRSVDHSGDCIPPAPTVGMSEIVVLEPRMVSISC